MQDEPKNDSDVGRIFPFLLRSLPKIVASQRVLAYASEVGESFRPIVPLSLVRTSYALSFFYVGADVMVHNDHLRAQRITGTPLAVKTADRLLWHGFASLLLPALSVHTVVNASTAAIKRVPAMSKYPLLRTWSPTVLALGSIPFIIHPLDHLTDFFMDNTIRRIY